MIRRAAVVGQFQDGGVDRRGGSQQRRLSRLLGVSREEDAAAGTVDAQHHGAVVELPLCGSVRRGPEHVHRRLPESESFAGDDRQNRHPRRPGGRPRRQYARRGVRLRRDGADEQRADIEPLNDSGQASAVVIMTVGEHNRVEPVNASLAQLCPHTARVRAAVDEQTSRAAVASRRLDQERVALPDVKHHQPQRVDPLRGQHAGGGGPKRLREESRERDPAKARRSMQHRKPRHREQGERPRPHSRRIGEEARGREDHPDRRPGQGREQRGAGRPDEDKKGGCQPESLRHRGGGTGQQVRR